MNQNPDLREFQSPRGSSGAPCEVFECTSLRVCLIVGWANFQVEGTNANERKSGTFKKNRKQFALATAQNIRGILRFHSKNKSIYLVGKGISKVCW